MNNAINSLTPVFTGKGGTLRFVIACSLTAAVVYEIMDYRYGFSMTGKDGTSVTLKPCEPEALSATQSEA